MPDLRMCLAKLGTGQNDISERDQIAQPIFRTIFVKISGPHRLYRSVSILAVASRCTSSTARNMSESAGKSSVALGKRKQRDDEHEAPHGCARTEMTSREEAWN